MNRSTPGFPVHHQLQNLPKLMSVELVMPSSHLILSSPSPPAPNPSQQNVTLFVRRVLADLIKGRISKGDRPRLERVLNPRMSILIRQKRRQHKDTGGECRVKTEAGRAPSIAACDQKLIKGHGVDSPQSPREQTSLVNILVVNF